MPNALKRKEATEQQGGPFETAAVFEPETRAAHRGAMMADDDRKRGSDFDVGPLGLYRGEDDNKKRAKWNIAFDLMPAALGGRQTLANAVDTTHAPALECFWVSLRKKHIITAVQRAWVEASSLTPLGSLRCRF